MNKSIIKALKLTNEQRDILDEYMKREAILKQALNNCNVYPSAKAHIMESANLDAISEKNTEELEEIIKAKFPEFINSKGV